MNRKIAVLLLVVLLSCTALAACEKSASQVEPGGDESPAEPTPKSMPAPTPAPPTDGAFQIKYSVAQSDAPREAASAAAQTDQSALAAANRAFAFDLYRALCVQDGNLFYSPHSISLALAMTYTGARGETQAQMAGALHYDLPPERLHPAFNALDAHLASRNRQDAFQLHLANSIWGQADYTFLPDFLDALARNYGAGLRLLDFVGATEASRQAINDWISQQTEDRIRDLIPSGGVTMDTRLVLANAIYFDADWLHPFAGTSTSKAPFNTLNAGQVTVDMMSMSDPVTLRYASGQDYQAVELPYTGDEMAMLILLPGEGQFERFEAGLDAELLADALKQLESKQVQLWLPRFAFESSFNLADTLAALGMPDAFDPLRADFSGMDGTRNLMIGNVFHKAFVAVDEAGTEAAAATAVVMTLTAMPACDVQLLVDRPFVFVIYDLESGAVLFVGRVLNPHQASG